MKTIIKMIMLLIALNFSNELLAQTENIVVVSADKMNVLYMGIANPISIAVPGVTSDKLKVSINHGTITGSNGKYIVTVDNVIETTIEVTAEVKPGVIKKVGSSTFRIKRMPSPVACIGTNCNTNLFISKEEILKDPQIYVSLNLPFDYVFEVISFSLNFTIDKEIKEIMTSGNKFNQKMIDAINKIENGSIVIIDDIKVKGPDGTTTILSPIRIKIPEK